MPNLHDGIFPDWSCQISGFGFKGRTNVFNLKLKLTLSLAVAIAGLFATPAFADSNASGGTVLNSETVVLGGPFDHGADPGDADNSTTTAVFAGGFTANSLRFSGTTTAVVAGTWGEESDIVATEPGLGGSTFTWESTGDPAAYTAFDFDNSQSITGTFAAGIDPGANGGSWGLEFIDTFDDDTGADSQTTNLEMTFEEADPIMDSDNTVALSGLGGLGSSDSSVGELALGGLLDTYTFTLTGTGFFSASTFSDTSVFTGVDLDTEIFLLDSTGELLATNDDIAAGVNAFSEVVDIALGPGSYSLVVGGFDTSYDEATDIFTAGDDIGDYGITASFVVPEPSSLALLAVAGLGVGYRRRR